MHIEDVVRYPLPGYSLPNSFRFSPCGQWLTYLASPEAGLRQALCAMSLESGTARVAFDAASIGADERTLSLEEQLRRERLRQRGVGVTSYQFAERGRRVLIPIGGALCVMDGVDGKAGPAREVVAAATHATQEPRISPDGEWIGFVRDAELYVVSAAGGEPRQITSGARGTGRTNGLSEYIAQEEMHRHEGWWWSDDGAQIAFVEVDETHIPIYRIVHQGKDGVGVGAQEDHRYPFAGAANAKVRLGVVPREGGTPRFMDLPPFEYLARVHWAADGSLYVQTQNRAQNALSLLRVDAATGKSTVLITETSASWVNLHESLRPIAPCAAAPAGGFLWASERTGFRHLSLHDGAGHRLRDLTSGPWMVESVVGVDAARGLVWFTGTRDGATERHLYEVSLLAGTDSAPRKLTADPGLHDIVGDTARGRFLDHHSSLVAPPSVRVRSLADGSELRLVHGVRDPRIDALGLTAPELTTLKSRDGETLHAAIYRPAASHGVGPFPVIVSVYGGPHVQRVANSWELTANLRAQYLRSLGFLVLVVDNRGSSRRGLAFESAIHLKMGEIEVNDQEDGVRELVRRGLADPARVGIYGWSYGGYMAAMCVARAGATFRAGCAGAPVTSWDGYDTHYTERYMSTPTENREGYAASSVMHHVPNMTGALLLIHGMLDENVHFRHTARLVNALNRARKRYQLLMYPDERHMPRSEADRVHMEEQVRDFFVRELA